MENLVTVISTVVPVALGILALWQNHIYKKQSDRFEELTIMPEFYYVIPKNNIQLMMPKHGKRIMQLVFG